MQNKLIRFLLLFISVMTQAVMAQSYYFKNYTVDNGLPFVQVSAIFQDDEGNLWTGGYGGLSKFNGRKFTNYTPKNGLVHHWVTSIVQDKKGVMWIGTINGLSTYHHKKFTNYTTDNGLPGNSIRAIVNDANGDLWFATNNGLARYDGKSFYALTTANGLLSDDVLSLYLDKNKTLWIGTSKGLCSYSNNVITQHNQKQPKYSVAIKSIVIDSAQSLWMATPNGLLGFSNGNYTLYTTQNGLPDNVIRTIVIDTKGLMWLGTNKGMVRVGSEKNKIIFKNYEPDNVLSSKIVECMYVDYEGNIWVGTFNGLYRYKGDVFGLFAEKEGLTNTFIFQILRLKNNELFVGSAGSGFYLFDDYRFRNFSITDGLSGNTVNTAITNDDGTVWIGTDGGLSLFNGKSFVNYKKKDGLISDSVSALYKDKNGDLWIGGNQGITIYKDKKFNAIHLKGKFSNFDIWAIHRDKKGQLWLGSYLGGLFKQKSDGSFYECASEIGLPSNSIFNILETSDGDLIFGTLDGGFLYDGKTIHRFSVDEGLSSDLVYSIVLDADENIWAGANQGMCKINTKEFKKTGKKIIHQYGKEEGFQGVESNTNGGFKDADGTMWFGTVNGLIKYSPQYDFPNKLEPKTSIVSVVVNDRDTTLPNNAQLKHYMNTLAFEFIGVSLTNPNKVMYMYMLEGVDKTWSLPTKENVVKYSGLQNGTYTLKVLSANNEGVWNQAPVTLTFTILPPFWKAWWFRILLTIAIMLLLFTFFYYRLNQVRTEERKRSELEKRIASIELIALRSQMNPHFIFNTMSSIQNYISANDTDAALRYLSRFAKLMRAIMENTKQSTITIKDELDTLKLYLELESMRFTGKFHYEINIDKNIDVNYDEIPSMLIQPYVENAIIHGLLPKGQGGKLVVDLVKKDNFIVCTIEDNGVGRTKSKELSKNRLAKHKSMGMSITKERLTILNYSAKTENKLSEEIVDLLDKEGNSLGTKIIIYVPI